MAKEFEELKASGQRNPEAHMLRSFRKAGQYQGCLSKSHWGGRREKDNWDLFIKHAPELSKKVSEVPNNLRSVLGIQVTWLHLYSGAMKK